MIVSAYGFAGVLSEHVTLDPSRMAAQVVSGIGFLGAGAILARGEVIRGLTTAASVWSVAAIGLAVGGGLYTEAVAATVIILIILAGLKPLERRFSAGKQRRQLLIVAEHGALSIDKLHQALGPSSDRVEQFLMQQQEEAAELDEIEIVLNHVSPQEFALIWKRLHKVPGLRDLREHKPS